MLAFYCDLLGFKVKKNLGQYIELESESVRLALCDRDIMLKATDDKSFLVSPEGQAYELAFPCDTPDDVDKTFDYLIEHGAKAIKAPASMPWGQRTAFFADPEGTIHEIFSDLSGEG
jgi:uncharacterized glyoxalase superfamily protein PhnB